MKLRSDKVFLKAAMICVMAGFVPLTDAASQQRSSLIHQLVSTHESGTASRPAPVLLELFTSEGCSSCPPADALLKEVDRKQTPSGQLLIGLSEHVTYWNNLGWRDPFSSDQYTARQNGYSERFNLDGVYTPQLVINGTEQVVGSDRQGLARALHKEQERGGKMPATLQIDSVRRVPGGLAVTYSLALLAPGRSAELFAAIADNLDQTSVLRGENGGRTLTHAAVVRTLAALGPATAVNDRQITLHLATTTAQRQHLVLFVQEANFGPVLGVAQTPLSP